MSILLGNRVLGNCFPPVVEQVKNFAGFVGRTVTAVAMRIPIYVPKDEAERRGKICMACPQQKNGRCLLCGCCTGSLIFNKTKFAYEQCPDNPPRWVKFDLIKQTPKP
jgi:hypothetical protein